MLIAWVFLACGGSNSPAGCLDTLIAAGPQQIDRYTWNGADYYHVDHGCCDQYLDVYKANTCAFVCAPSGGIAGRGDDQCPTFYQEAVQQETVYTKP